MKLEYGKRYVTRGGEVTLALMNSGSEDYPFYGIIRDEGFSWKGTGEHFDGSFLDELDLVSEYTEPQSGLTKREFMQQFVLANAHAGIQRSPVTVTDYAGEIWDLIEEKCK